MNADARFVLAEIAEAQQDYRRVVGYLLAAIELDPEYLEAYLKLGNLYFIGQAYERAAEQARAPR